MIDAAADPEPAEQPAQEVLDVGRRGRVARAAVEETLLGNLQGQELGGPGQGAGFDGDGRAQGGLEGAADPALEAVLHHRFPGQAPAERRLQPPVGAGAAALEEPLVGRVLVEIGGPQGGVEPRSLDRPRPQRQ